MITKGTNQINKIALGANEIGRIYLGNGIVYGGEGEALPYDAELEYLQSSGSAYIDSGVECTGDLSVAFKIMLLSDVNAAAAGAIAQTSSGYFRHHLTMSGPQRYWLQNNSSNNAAFYGGTSPSLNTWYEIAIDATNFIGTSGNTNLIVRSSYGPLPATLSAGCNYGIFARFSPTIAVQGRPCRFAYFKLSRNGSTLRDFIPVRVGTVGYMYDKVTKQLFGNDGTDSFILGPDK